MIFTSEKHKTVFVPTHPALITHFPNAPKVTYGGNDYLGIPHGPDETLFLRNLGIAAPAPVLSQYDWNGGTPFEIQKLTAALLTTNKRAYVLNSFGTGKTKSSLWAWDFLSKLNMAGKVLVIAPLSTLTFTWAKEVFDTLPDVKVQVLHGTRERRLKRLSDPDADIFIINHDGFGTIEDELKKYPEIDTLIIDELAAYRNGGAIRTKKLRIYAKTMKWVWGMTGSPTPNEPTDAWGQASIVTPYTIPKYFGRFRDEVMQKVSQFRWVPRHNATETVYKVLQPAVRFTLSDVMELPELVERTQDVEMGAEQEKIYKQMVTHARACIADKQIDAMNAGAVLNKLLQISTGYVYTRNGETCSLDNNERIQAMLDAVESAEGKVIVFVPFKHALDGVYAALFHENVDVKKISGDTPKGERDEVFKTFQTTSFIRVIAAHPGTMSHGLTLTAADTIIWFGPTTSLETFEQANARITRVGQKRKQLVLMLQSTKVEKQMYARLRAKQKVQNMLLEMFEEA